MRPIDSTLSAQDLRDLADLIVHPGWKLVEIMVDREWGAAGFGERIAQTIGQPDLDPSRAVQHLQQATVAQQAVQRVIRWPREVVTAAKQQALGRVASMNRGGV